jgi:hypothetical protein
MAENITKIMKLVSAIKKLEKRMTIVLLDLAVNLIAVFRKINTQISNIIIEGKIEKKASKVL